MDLPSEQVRRKAQTQQYRKLQDRRAEWGIKQNKIMLLKPQIMF